MQPSRHVALITLATIYYTAWYEIVMQRSLVVYHRISHLSLVFSRYTQPHVGKIRVTLGIPLENVA